ncbi:class I SAM-dependent methyltransferase [Propionibacterium acidifaciens]|uniref:class I SAM-dependent methyltransferase n=1 Tax=Propionibacterium acidifaciens TaxID=556499 RepID=UPI0023F45294|nr:class I SAM-dependent methyltransferase [Propionibacterium acidifaciens]
MTNRDEQPLRTDPAEYAAAEFELQSTGQADYGNCVPSRLMRVLFILCGVLLLVFALLLIVWAHASALIVVGLLCALVIAFTVYMELCRRLFAFDGGGLMGAMHQMVVDNLDWDGRGRLLDIGCGAAALTARCAMTFPDGEFTGIDNWGATRSRAKEQCEANARAEGITAPMSFVEGDAAHLDFPDGSFDAAVSNFVFHEVRSEPDKRALVREALRVVRPGGAFSFQDLFAQPRLYGDMTAFVQELRAEGVSDIEYIPHTENLVGAPSWVRTPWMIRNAGILHGHR